MLSITFLEFGSSTHSNNIRILPKLDQAFPFVKEKSDFSEWPVDRLVRPSSGRVIVYLSAPQ